MRVYATDLLGSDKRVLVQPEIACMCWARDIGYGMKALYDVVAVGGLGNV